MGSWLDLIKFDIIEMLIIMTCFVILITYLVETRKQKGYDKKHDNEITIAIVGLILNEVRKENIDLSDNKIILDVLTLLLLDECYRKKFIDKNSECLLEYSKNKNIGKIVSLLQKEIL